MRKIIAAVLLLPSLSIASAPLTSQSIPAVISVSNQTIQDVRALATFAYNVQQIVNANFTFTIPGTNETVQMTPQQQADMFAAYVQLKATVQTDLANLP